MQNSWWEYSLRSQMRKLIEAVSLFGYTGNERSAQAVDAAACSMERLLPRLHALCEQDGNGIGTAPELSMMLIEAHQQIVHARQLIGSVLAPRKAGNVVEMRRSHTDLTDAEFERLLAASDIDGGSDTANLVDWSLEVEAPPEREKPQLTLVSSSTTTCKRPEKTLQD